METPLTAHPPQKRSFIPSKWEKLRVGRMVHSIKMGWMKPSKPKRDPNDPDAEDEPFYDLWRADEEVKMEDMFGLRTTLDRSTPYPKFSTVGAWTHDLQIMTVHFMSLRFLL